MSNLTKYEKLQHRHLSLLKALADAGVEVSNQDGEWQIALPQPCAYVGNNNGFANFGGYPKCSTCHNTGTWRDGIEVLPCPAEGCPFRDTTKIWVNRFALRSGIGELFKFNTQHAESNSVVETYVREHYELKGNGDVSKYGKPRREDPQWVRNFDKQWGLDRAEYNMQISNDVVQTYDRATGDRSIVPITPLLRNLLDALRHAMVPPSPAKVD